MKGSTVAMMVAVMLVGLIGSAQAEYLFNSGPENFGEYWNGIGVGGEFTLGDDGILITRLGTYDSDGDGFTVEEQVRFGYVLSGNQRTLATVDFAIGEPGELINVDGQDMFTRFDLPDTPGGIRLPANTTWRIFATSRPLGTGAYSTSADIASFTRMYNTGGLGGWALGSSYYAANAEYDIDNTTVAFNYTSANSWNSQDFTFGNRFTVGDEPLIVYELGAFDRNYDGLYGPAEVGLWADDGTLLGQVTIPAGKSGILTPVQALAGGWRSVALDTPVLLEAGQTYRVGAYMKAVGGNTDDVLNGVTMVSTADYTILDGVYNVTQTQLAMPGIGSGSPYAAATFGYATIQTCDDVKDFGYYDLMGDLNGDCYVEWADFGIFASNWQKCLDPSNDDCDKPWIP